MNREQAKKYWQFIKAYGEGKELQYRKVGEIEWHVERKHLGFCFDVDDCEFRIKPEENYTIEQNAGENRIEGGVLSVSGIINDKCYKCGKQLTLENVADVVLTSNPPKFMCKECAGEKEKHYKPFEDAAELILEYHNRFHVNNYCIEEPLIWVKKKVCSGDERSLITAYDINCVFIQDIWIDLTELFEKYTFLDDSACGVENEIRI